MARLIEVDNLDHLPAAIVIKRSDVLLFRASGGYVTAGSDCIRVTGPMTTGTILADATVISPSGPPNAILFEAILQGKSQIEVLTGDPFYAPIAQHIEIRIE